MMDIPIRLNFFKSAEQYLEIRLIDRQYDEQMQDYDKREALRSGTGLNLNLPTWNLEKKILGWSHLKHKHLGSAINTKLLLDKEFLEDINSSETEVKFCGAKETIDNLIAHNFASKSEDGGAILNPAGLFAGALISNLYFFKKTIYTKKDKKIKSEFIELRPHFLKDMAYHIIYLVAWLLIFESIFLLILEILGRIGLMDELKNIVNVLEIPKVTILLLILSPFYLLFIGIIIILFPKFKR